MVWKKRGNKKRNGKMKNRRGLSTVVITLILVLLVIVAVFLLWGPIKRFIKGNTEMANIQNEFFGEQINILSVYINDPFVNITLKKPAGELKTVSFNITIIQSPPIAADIFSVMDLSGSMRECYNLNSTNCTNIGGSYSIPPNCDFLSNSTSNKTACTSSGGTWNGQCSNITSIQCTNIGGSYRSSICKDLNTNRNIACTSSGGRWYGQCTSMNSSKCNSLGGSFSPSICDTLPPNYATACTNYTGVPNDKLTAAQDANRNLITSLFSSGTNRVGLVGYNGTVVSSGSISLTTDSNLLNTTLSSWQSTGGTCICCGINNASARLIQQSSQGKLKIMIVMSDGGANQECSQQNTGNAVLDAIKAACDANSSLNNLTIYSIGFLGADQDTLINISNCGGGKYYSVANIGDLIAVYQTIAKQIQDTYKSATAFNYLYAKFYNATDFDREQIIDIPTVLETKTYNFNLAGKLSGRITRIEIYPVVVSASREEIVGPLLAFWDNKN